MVFSGFVVVMVMDNVGTNMHSFFFMRITQYNIHKQTPINARKPYPYEYL